eukprot:XP_027325989.1 uncharacterized protein LOC110353943 isoform X5 [Anas platyrhynchos]
MQPPLQGAELRVLPCPAPGAAREAGSCPVPQAGVTAPGPAEEPGGDSRAGSWCLGDLERKGERQQGWLGAAGMDTGPGGPGDGGGHPKLGKAGWGSGGGLGDSRARGWGGQGCGYTGREARSCSCVEEVGGGEGGSCLSRGSQRGRDGGTGQAQRASSTLQDKKLELQERLRELQHRTRSLLRQRLETLEQLRVLLREEEATASHQLQKAVEKRWSRRPRLRSATSPSPSTSPGLRQHSPGSPRLLHHIQRCLQELQVDKTHRTGSLEHPEVLGGELGTAASEEEWGQPGTRDSPPVTASPKQKRFLVADTPRPSRRKHDCRSRRLL